MNTAPPRGTRLVKQSERIQIGDYIMTANRPGEWHQVTADHGLDGIICSHLAWNIEAAVKLARTEVAIKLARKT